MSISHSVTRVLEREPELKQFGNTVRMEAAITVDTLRAPPEFLVQLAELISSGVVSITMPYEDSPVTIEEHVLRIAMMGTNGGTN